MGLLSPASSPSSQPTVRRRHSVGPRLSSAAPPQSALGISVPWCCSWAGGCLDKADAVGCCIQHTSPHPCWVKHMVVSGNPKHQHFLTPCLTSESPLHPQPIPPGHRAQLQPLAKGAHAHRHLHSFPTPSSTAAAGWLCPVPQLHTLRFHTGAGAFAFPCPPPKPEGPCGEGKVAQTERSRAASAGPRCSTGG